MSERVGKKRSTIANYLRLLKLDPIIQTGIRDGFISMGHGRAIINIENQDIQTSIYQKIVSQNLPKENAIVNAGPDSSVPQTNNDNNCDLDSKYKTSKIIYLVIIYFFSYFFTLFLFLIKNTSNE